MATQRKQPQTPRYFHADPVPAKAFTGEVGMAAGALHGIGTVLEGGGLEESVELGLCAAVKLVGEYLDYVAVEMNPAPERIPAPGPEESGKG
ncbi:hypothetical protein [Halomonas ramblicola]|uniref:hypothetical protein n=1 Tax=Halomonas ramblicola TaxID=747349 RepID=UPI0025B4F643|nr:hypothetical protein [Halomonas ramblicola]MDN3521521.1 hypothetical protein [Halomonas ramblicola]